MFNYEYYKGFLNSQYEDINNGKFLYREQVNARYIIQEEQSYRGNLLIEALSPVKDCDGIVNFLKKFPVYSEEEKFFNNEYRIHAIFRLLDCLFPTTSNLLTDEYLSVVIRRGYVNKKIGTPEYMKILRKANEYLINGTAPDTELVTQSSIASNSSTGFLVMGASGAGKSTALNNCLSYYPQVIKHFIDDNGIKKMFTQVPWIKIDCSYDGNISGVCIKFFQEMDEILGTNYTAQYGAKGTVVNKMIASISYLALKYAIGVLVVDEIQHIRHTNNGESLLNFFVTLSNTVKVPIVYVGTYKASKTILGEQYRQSRKAEGIGLVEFLRLKQIDDEWDTFISLLWDYQWVKNKTPLTNEIKDLMHKRTLGIIDRVIKLFMAVQLQAIDSGIEKITPELINKVADEKFKLTDAIIKAYESDDPNKISQCEDIKAPDMGLEDYLDRNSIVGKLNEIYNSEAFKENLNKQKVIDSIVVILNQTMQYKKDEIENIAIEVVNKIGFDKNISVLLKEVAKKLLQAEMVSQNDKINKTSKKTVKNKKKQVVPDNFVEENKKDILEGIE